MKSVVVIITPIGGISNTLGKSVWGDDQCCNLGASYPERVKQRDENITQSTLSSKL